MKEKLVLILKKFAKLLKKLIKKPITKTIATGAIAVTIAILILPIELALVSLIVLFGHEFAHYVSAWNLGAEPEFPFFIPLGIILIGITRVKNLNKKDIPTVALSGPIMGMYLALIGIALGFAISSPILMMGAAGSFVFELFAATLGSDGSRARKWRKLNNI